jgi:alkanesulfonate monooxygenase SsuD/methylene tetrahydromethanopterin reductase-like flavin-dependent oxidoreductase (luciferase family)
VRIGIKPGQWGWSFDELVASWRAADEAGFGVISCFDHVSARPAEAAAWDAPTLLSAMAGVTTRAGLAVDVVNSVLRHPFLLAGQVAVAQAASAGRLEVGLGAGSYHLARHDHDALGIPFPPHAERLDRLEGCCRVLPALWRGQSVTDQALGLRDASLGPVGIAPPRLVVGGRSERAMEIAARYADGWNLHEPEPAAYRRALRRMDDVCDRVGRQRRLWRHAQLFVRAIGPYGLRDAALAASDAGIDSLVFVLDEERGPEWVRRVADAVL